MRKIKNAKYPLLVKKSRIEGERVFAATAIPWGVKIIEFQGARISNAEAGGDRWHRYQTRRRPQ
jgi:SET domain-containing protein